MRLKRGDLSADVECKLMIFTGALVNSSLPTVLVATKCDNPESSRQIDTEALATACQSCLATFKTAANKPETARMSLFTLLKALVLSRQGQLHTPGSGSYSVHRAGTAQKLEHQDTGLCGRY